MKQLLFYAVAASLFLSTGCSKQEEAETQTPKEAVSKPAPVVPETPAQKVQTAGEQLTEKAIAVKTQLQAAGAEAVQTVKSAAAVTSADILADLKLSPDEVKTNAAGYDQSQLMAYANGYKEVITEKKEQLTTLAGQLKELPVAEMLGGKGKDLKAQLSQYTSQLSALKERYGVYLDLLKNYGVDLSAYGL